MCSGAISLQLKYLTFTKAQEVNIYVSGSSKWSQSPKIIMSSNGCWSEWTPRSTEPLASCATREMQVSRGCQVCLGGFSGEVQPSASSLYTPVNPLVHQARPEWNCLFVCHWHSFWSEQTFIHIST